MIRLGTIGVVIAVIWTARFCPAVEVEIVTVEGLIHRGELESWTKAGSIRIRNSNEPVGLSREQVLRVYRLGAATTSIQTHGEAAVLFFSDGQVIFGELLSFDSHDVEVETQIMGRMVLASDRLRAARWGDVGSGANAEAANRFDELRREAGTTRDSLLMYQGDSVRLIGGVLESLDETNGRFSFQDESLAFRRDRVYGIVLAAAGSDAKPARATIRLIDGQRLAGRVISADGEKLRLRTTLGPEVGLAWERIVSADFAHDEVVFLSELEPASYSFEPLLNTEWAWRRDRAVAGAAIRLDGRAYERGLGVHSQSRLTYELRGEYRTFAALVGIDDSVRPRGSVVFKITADGSVLWESGNVRGSDRARPVRVSVAGVQELSLAVEFGEDLDIADHADWGDARLIRR